MSYMGERDYVKAEGYWARLSAAYRGETSKDAQEAANMLQLCQMNTMYTGGRWLSGGGGAGAGASGVADLSALMSRFGFRGNY